jgi:hypothetical protein
MDPVSEFGDWVTVMAKLVVAAIIGLVNLLPIVALTQITSTKWKIITIALIAYLLPSLITLLLNPSSHNLLFISAR